MAVKSVFPHCTRTMYLLPNLVTYTKLQYVTNVFNHLLKSDPITTHPNPLPYRSFIFPFPTQKKNHGMDCKAHTHARAHTHTHKAIQENKPVPYNAKFWWGKTLANR